MIGFGADQDGVIHAAQIKIPLQLSLHGKVLGGEVAVTVAQGDAVPTDDGKGKHL